MIGTDGVEQQHTLWPVPDHDWVKFNATSGVTYQITPIPVGADASLKVELYSACDRPATATSDASFEFSAPADGLYFLHVQHRLATYGPDTAYRLKISALDACSGHYEPNNLCALAGDIGLNAPAQVHNFCRANDVDWARFPVNAGVTYVVSVTNVGASADAILSLYQDCDTFSGGGTGQVIPFTAATSGYMYLKAANLNPAVFGSNTDYLMHVTELSACVPDAFEPDDTPALASTLTINGAVQAHTHCPAADTDYARFQAATGVTYTLETTNLGSQADTVLCLYDPTGTTQIMCDESGAGLGARLHWQAPASGSYLLRVQHANPGIAGADTHYDLSVSTDTCAEDAFEPDNLQSQAVSINIGSPSTPHTICPAGDADWLSFTAPVGSYVIDTVDLGPEADTVLELHDAAGGLLAINDDYGPGTASRITYTVNQAGSYYLKVYHHNPGASGPDTRYTVRVIAGAPPTPTPTPGPTPTATPSPTPPPSEIQTLIVVNRSRLATMYDEASAATLITKLTQLAAHTQVKGDLVQLENNATVNTAYTAWTADSANVEKANQVAATIRAVIMTYVEQHPSVRYVVLVGDDRALPFRRVADRTPNSSYLEGSYPYVDNQDPTGAALRANYFLTDDYYVDRDPTIFAGRELYIPDLAIGRLVETPAEIDAFIDAFLASPQVSADHVLVTAWDVLQNVGATICQAWQADLGSSNVNCSLIGAFWSLADFRALHLNSIPPYKVQSINGHARHYLERIPGPLSISGEDIVTATSNLAGGVIYTPGCHAGLNVPPSNSHPLDLAQAYASKQANYIANTGYGWAYPGVIGLSDKLMSLYTTELRQSDVVTVGLALRNAKQQYYQQAGKFDGYDEKVMEELVFYGLPMYQLHTGAAFDEPNPFPSVAPTPLVLPLPDFGDIYTATAGLSLLSSLDTNDALSRTVTATGD